MIKREDVYKIGKITKAHGYKGEVVFIFEDDIFDRNDADYLICDVEGILVPFFIEEYRFRSNNSALMKFDDIDSAEKAERILGSDVYFERKQCGQNEEEEEYSLYYFVGFTIMDGDKEVGTIADVDTNTENWLFVTEDNNLIPANEDFIVDINHEDKIIIMNLPLGLLELNN